MIDKGKLREITDAINKQVTQRYRVEMLEEWLKQNQSEPVVVGLSDEQIIDLEDYLLENICGDFSVYTQVSDVIRQWQKDQSFTQPKPFSPNWDDAPSWANWLAQNCDGSWRWFEDKPKWVNDCWAGGFNSRCEYVSRSENWKQSLQERPKPTPQIEVGQVWKNSKCEVTVIGINDAMLAYQENNTKNFGTHGIQDFLAKFEKVQP